MLNESLETLKHWCQENSVTIDRIYWIGTSCADGEITDSLYDVLTVMPDEDLGNIFGKQAAEELLAAYDEAVCDNKIGHEAYDEINKMVAEALMSHGKDGFIVEFRCPGPTPMPDENNQHGMSKDCGSYHFTYVDEIDDGSLLNHMQSVMRNIKQQVENEGDADGNTESLGEAQTPVHENSEDPFGV